MAQRSPYNDRYKVDSKGKTRKSASAAKPKRAVADLTPAEAAKKSQKKRSLWSRATSASGSGASSASARMESTPRMKQLRRVWWALWITALAIAVGILLLQQAGMEKSPLVLVGWVIWLAAMGGAFYLEFGPIRKERALAIQAAKGGGKPAKKDKADKAASPDKTPQAPAPDDRQPSDPEDSE
jgi:hypothetical protein